MKIQVTRSWTERPRGALLYPGFVFLDIMCRISGRLGYYLARDSGAVVEIPLLIFENTNRSPLSGNGTESGGQFDWGGRLPKSNGGAQRFPQDDWKPSIECKGIRELDCESNISSRYESRT